MLDDDEDDERAPHCCFCDALLGSWDDEDPEGAACNDCFFYYERGQP